MTIQQRAGAVGVTAVSGALVLCCAVTTWQVLGRPYWAALFAVAGVVLIGQALRMARW